MSTITNHRRFSTWRYLRSVSPPDSSTNITLAVESGGIVAARRGLLRGRESWPPPTGEHAAHFGHGEEAVPPEGAVAGDLALVRPGANCPSTHAERLRHLGGAQGRLRCRHFRSGQTFDI